MGSLHFGFHGIFTTWPTPACTLLSAVSAYWHSASSCGMFAFGVSSCAVCRKKFKQRLWPTTLPQVWVCAGTTAGISWLSG